MICSNTTFSMGNTTFSLFCDSHFLIFQWTFVFVLFLGAKVLCKLTPTGFMELDDSLNYQMGWDKYFCCYGCFLFVTLCSWF